MTDRPWQRNVLCLSDIACSFALRQRVCTHPLRWLPTILSVARTVRKQSWRTASPTWRRKQQVASKWRKRRLEKWKQEIACNAIVTCVCVNVGRVFHKAWAPAHPTLCTQCIAAWTNQTATQALKRIVSKIARKTFQNSAFKRLWQPDRQGLEVDPSK